MLPEAARTEFDRFLEEILGKLPPDVHKLLKDISLIVDDEPTAELKEEVGIRDNHTDLCGLHSGIPLNQRSVWETPVLPGQIYLFRGPIYRVAQGSPQRLRRQLEL